MNNNKPKMEFSKIFAIASFIPLIVSIWMVFYFVCKIESGNTTLSYNIITSMLTYMVMPSFAFPTVVFTCYAIKTKAENLIKLQIYSIYSLIDIQKGNPEFQIYTTINAKQDANNITTTISNQMDTMTKMAINENASTKI